MGDNYWTDLVEGKIDNSTEGVKPYFEKRAKELGESTNGVVTAAFEKAFRLDAENNPILEGVSYVTQELLMGTASVTMPPKRKDANNLYDGGLYAFEIRSASYRFRVFKVKLEAVYPISFELDEGVYSELDDGEKPISAIYGNDDANKVYAESDEEDDSLFRAILRTKKVRYLVVRLIEMTSEREER